MNRQQKFSVWLSIATMWFCIFAMLSTARSAEFIGADVGLYGGVQQVTNDTETVQLGLSLDWTYVSVDLSTGIKRVAWRVESEPEWMMDEWQSGSIAAVRGYPFGWRYEKVRPLVTWIHMSDVSRGEPFNDREEPTSDYVGVGMTFVIDRVELDLTIGKSGRECAWFSCGSSSLTTEGQIQIRGYFVK